MNDEWLQTLCERIRSNKCISSTNINDVFETCHLDDNEYLQRLSVIAESDEKQCECIIGKLREVCAEESTTMTLIKLAMKNSPRISVTEFMQLIQVVLPLDAIDNLLQRWLSLGTDINDKESLCARIGAFECVIVRCRKAIQTDSFAGAKQLYQRTTERIEELLNECKECNRCNLVMPLFSMAKKSLEDRDLLLLKRSWALLMSHRVQCVWSSHNRSEIIDYIWTKVDVFDETNVSERCLKLATFFCSQLSLLDSPLPLTKILTILERCWQCMDASTAMTIHPVACKLFASLGSLTTHSNVFVDEQKLLQILNTLNDVSIIAVINHCTNNTLCVKNLFTRLFAATQQHYLSLISHPFLIRNTIAFVHQLAIKNTLNDAICTLLLESMMSPIMLVARFVVEAFTAFIVNADVSSALDITHYIVNEFSQASQSSGGALTREIERWTMLIIRVLRSCTHEAIQKCLIGVVAQVNQQDFVSSSHRYVLAQLPFTHLHQSLQSSCVTSLLSFAIHHVCSTSMQPSAQLATSLVILSSLFHSFGDVRALLSSNGPRVVSSLMRLLVSNSLVSSSEQHSALIDCCSHIVCVLTPQQIQTLLPQLINIFETNALIRPSLINFIHHLRHTNAIESLTACSNRYHLHWTSLAFLAQSSMTARQSLSHTSSHTQTMQCFKNTSHTQSVLYGIDTTIAELASRSNSTLNENLCAQLQIRINVLTDIIGSKTL